MMNMPEDEEAGTEIPAALNAEDKWILSRYNTVVREVTENMEKFELGIAVQKVYEFIWDEFCDW
jgi:valyl-tRNA synthetase